MSVYDEDGIRTVFQRNLESAKSNLAELEVFCGRKADFGGLSGWVFEQTIQYCLQKELDARGLSHDMKEQQPLDGRAKVDLLIGGRLAIEIKSRGLFGRTDIERYRRYSEAAKQHGLVYLFLTASESYQPYRDGIADAVGREGVFFLDVVGSWDRFLMRIVNELCPDERRLMDPKSCSHPL
ncbi:MAG: hypothetical protein WCB27_21825 [Thermoguttaceae bacterium]|jgi:hypothetical protein